MRLTSLSASTAAVCFLIAPAAEAAFIVEARSGGKATANYAYTGATGTEASVSSTGVFAPGTTSGLGSIFGGNNTFNGVDPDQYTFSYTPALDADNTTFDENQVLNSFWNPDGEGEDEPLTATGLAGGGAGIYNVYVTYPQSANLDNAPTTFVASGDDGDAIYIVDQDADAPLSGTLDTGVAIGLWEIVGQVELSDPNQTYTITQTSTENPGFVSMRGFGVMWEFVSGLDSLLPGDADGDGDVDLADFTILRNNFGVDMGATVMTGDFNGDGTVDLADFTILRNNFGTTSDSDIAAIDAWYASVVPEPTTLGLAGVAGLGLLRRRR